MISVWILWMWLTEATTIVSADEELIQIQEGVEFGKLKTIILAIGFVFPSSERKTR